MANKLNNEDEIFAQIMAERSVVPDIVWDAIFELIGAKITAINLLINYYLELNLSIPSEGLREIKGYAYQMSDFFKKIISPKDVHDRGTALAKIRKESVRIHKNILMLFRHYVGNDIQAINFIVGYHLDEGAEPISTESARKILHYSASISTFLKKLRKATQEAA